MKCNEDILINWLQEMSLWHIQLMKLDLEEAIDESVSMDNNIIGVKEDDN